MLHTKYDYRLRLHDDVVPLVCNRQHGEGNLDKSVSTSDRIHCTCIHVHTEWS